MLRWLFPSVGASPLLDGHVIGRDADCGTQLQGQEISRRHAQVALREGQPWIRDLRSRNHTFVNAERVQERALLPGDVVRVGEWVGLVELGALPEEQLFGPVAPGWFGGRSLIGVAARARRAVERELRIVVQGASGAGKEGLARAIHAWSGRRGEFVAVDCGALSEQLAEGELFGYRKGAFTGAVRDNPGYFRSAQRGTLFLDEILNLPRTIQAKLLRVLQERNVVPLGEASPLPIDVLVVCGAQRPLQQAVAEGLFRDDLRARLEDIVVAIPSLRERKEDVLPLFRELWSRESKAPLPALEPRFVEALLLHDWPRNVRELVSVVRLVAALHDGEPRLRRSALPDEMLGRLKTPLAAARVDAAPSAEQRAKRAPTHDPAAFAELERRLSETDGNMARAARELGISRNRAYRLRDAQRRGRAVEGDDDR